MVRNGLLTLGVIAGLAIGSGWLVLAVREPANPELQPNCHVIDGLAVDPAALNLGEVWEERNFAWNLPIQNRTSAEIKVDEFTFS